MMNNDDNRRISPDAIKQMIDRYPEQYPTPKYLLFIRNAIDAGLEVGLHRAVTTRSKYVFVYHGQQRYKVRFSDHKPAYEREQAGDCDFFVGVANKTVTTTEQAWNATMRHFQMTVKWKA
jgi:hypothetical protein